MISSTILARVDSHAFVYVPAYFAFDALRLILAVAFLTVALGHTVVEAVGGHRLGAK